MASKGNEFIKGLRSFVIGIVVCEAELMKIMAEKDAMIVEKSSVSRERRHYSSKDGACGGEGWHDWEAGERYYLFCGAQGD